MANGCPATTCMPDHNGDVDLSTYPAGCTATSHIEWAKLDENGEPLLHPFSIKLGE